MTQPVQVIDCTLRDGSYAVNYQFTPQDTGAICTQLQDAGVAMIEIGHGLGLNASGARYGAAAADDRAYCEAAARVLKTSRFGAFFIPGIGRLEDLDMARDYGMGFVRIGASVDDIASALPFIAHGKRLGLQISFNAMKSYVAEPAQLADAAKRAASSGADMAYLVDSAGCMLPDDVAAYVAAMRTAVDVPIGFHGHNNLMLGVANSVAACRAGATMIDGTLQGIGRAGGNAQTEILVAVMARLGIETGIDLLKILNVGETLVRPFMRGEGMTSLDVSFGVGGFHSSFYPRVEAAAKKLGVDPKRLIIALGGVDRLDPSAELIEKVARSLGDRSA
jgi:4-hydroxy-2-oxovalerate aldolase